ncbi:MAG TPA: hypothetical protein V6D47_02275 [Oscillatoriaceae cyanobacterium]
MHLAPAHKLTIILADPSGGDRLLSALCALRDARLPFGFELIAVIGGDISRLAELQRKFPLITMLQVPDATDLGVLYSRGAAAAAGRYLLLLDGTVRVDAAAIEGMIHFLEKGQWIAMVAPRLIAPSGKELAATREFPTVASAIAEFRSRNTTGVTLRIQNPLDRQVTMPKEVDAAVSGCCMLKRHTVQEVGAFEAGYPAGGELLDWCRKVRFRGWSVFYHPGLTARLAEEPREDPARVAAQMASACRFIARYRGWTSVWTLKFLLGLISLHGLLLDGGASLIPGTHRHAARSAFWRAWYVFGELLSPRRRMA